MLINEQAIYDTWSPILENQKGIKDPYKLKWLSKYCHFHSLNDNVSLNESFGYSAYANLGSVNGMGAVAAPGAPGGPLAFYTAPTGSGDKIPSLLPMAVQVAHKTVGFDIVPVIPMQNPTGIVTYMDFNYGGGKIGSETKPTVIKIDADDINSTAYVVGTKYWGVSADSANNTDYTSSDVCVELIFVGYSKIDGMPIFRVGSTYTMTGTHGHLSAADTTITLSQIFNQSAVITTSVAGNSPTLNSGEPSAAAANSVDVTAKATLVKAFEDHIQGFVGAGTYDQDDWNGPFASGTKSANPMSRETGESTYPRSMTMTLYTKFVQAETFTVAASATQEQIQDLNKQYGMDVLNMLENTLINEISQSINKHILSRAFALGWSNNAEMYRVEGVTFNFTLDNTILVNGTSPAFLNKVGFGETIPYNKFQYYGDYENQATLQRRIKSKVLAASAAINHRGKRGAGNFIVTNYQIGVALQDNAQYTFAPVNNNINQDNGTLTPLGTVAGLQIYIDHNMNYNDTRILVGRKGGDDEPGLKFMPYLMAQSVQTISEATMAPKIMIKSRYALVEAGHWPETQYYTIYLHPGSVPII